jgi:hypothetical protein
MRKKTMTTMSIIREHWKFRFLALTLILMSVPCTLWATKGILLPEQEGTEDLVPQSFKDVPADKVYLPGDDSEPGPDYLGKVKERSYSLPDQIPDQEPKEEKGVSRRNYHLPGSGEDSSSYIESKDLELYEEMAGLGKNAFAFNYFQDNYKYQDKRNVFEKTFRQSTGKIKSGVIQFSLDRFLLRRYVELYWGGNLGISYNRGKGYYKNSTTESEAEFSLWMIPIDLSLGLEIPLRSWLKIGGSAGPTVMALLQSRSDFEKGEKGKRRRQLGYGHFVEAQAKIGLGRFFSGSLRKMHSSYKITNFYLSFYAREQNISNFQDDITVKGVSYGVGFTFDYL